MAIRLGDLLVQNAVITPAQLIEALAAQKTYGGRLGTNLIELGYVSEQALSKFLAVQLKLPSAGATELDDIPSAALNAVPRELAEKYRIVPVALSGRRLSVAMTDPTDLRAVDEVAFRTGYTIQPMVAPDVLLAYALEKHYGVRRESRYIRLSGAPDSEFQVVQPTSHYEAGEVRPDAQGAVQMEERGAFMELKNAEFVSKGFSPTDASRELAASLQPGDALSVLRRFIAEHLASSLFLASRAGRLWGHSGERLPVSEAVLHAFSTTPLESQLVAKVTQHLHAAFYDAGTGPNDAKLVSFLGLRPGGRVMAVPVIVNGQLLGVYFGATPRGAEQEAAGPVQQIATKTSYALQMIYLRKRILET